MNRTQTGLCAGPSSRATPLSQRHLPRYSTRNPRKLTSTSAIAEQAQPTSQQPVGAPLVAPTKCLKEWNVTIEALGNGEQTVRSQQAPTRTQVQSSVQWCMCHVLHITPPLHVLACCPHTRKCGTRTHVVAPSTTQPSARSRSPSLHPHSRSLPPSSAGYSGQLTASLCRCCSARAASRSPPFGPRPAPSCCSPPPSTPSSSC